MDSKPKNFILATVIVLACAAIFDWILPKIGVSDDFAKTVSAATLATLTYVQSMLDNRSIRPKSGLLPKGIVRPERYWLSWKYLIVYGTFIFIATIEVTGFLVGISTTFVFGEQPFDILLMALLPTTIFVSSFTAFLLGRWIGTRIDRNGILTIVLVVLLGRILVVLGDFLLLGEAELGGPKTVSYFFIMMADGILLFLTLSIIAIVCGIIGYRHGYRLRSFDYLRYLLGTLPSNTRETVIDLVYDETKRLSPEKPTNSKVSVQL